jgi:hypothetical protein
LSLKDVVRITLREIFKLKVSDYKVTRRSASKEINLFRIKLKEEYNRNIKNTKKRCVNGKRLHLRRRNLRYLPRFTIFLKMEIYRKIII